MGPFLKNRSLGICIADDRTSSEMGIRLLLLSLRKYIPNVSVELFFPCAQAPFEVWLQGHPQVRLHKRNASKAGSWNIKPEAMLWMLDQGYERAVWIDSDIIITSEFLFKLTDLDRQKFVITEEALGPKDRDDRLSLRARKWGFEVGREFGHVLNTCVLSVTDAHISLLKHWNELMNVDAYRLAQTEIWHERPIELLGDQDVLTALLASVLHADVDLVILKRGKQIVQFYELSGYTLFERIGNILYGGPDFIHCPGRKPWLLFEEISTMTAARDRIVVSYHDVSPYKLASLPYRQEIGLNTDWMSDWYYTGKLQRALGLNSVIASGALWALVIDCSRVTKKFFIKVREAARRDIGRV
jgi:hypothetical protein